MRSPRQERSETAECTWCGRPAEGRLCETCRLGLERYPDQNPPIVAAYVAAGLSELDAYLGRWAEFDRWLVLHRRQPGRLVPATR
jgi:hypothetical protein